MMTRAQMETRRLQGAEMLRDASPATVARELGVTRTSTGRWAAAVRDGEGLQARKATGRPCRISGEQLRSLYSLWETRARWTNETFAAAIRMALGVKYDPDHVGRLILRLGLRPARVKRAGQMELVGGSA